jgi:hypothetical protein
VAEGPQAVGVADRGGHSRQGLVLGRNAADGGSARRSGAG